VRTNSRIHTGSLQTIPTHPPFPSPTRTVPRFGLRLTPCLLARIYTGRMTGGWADAALAEPNAWGPGGPSEALARSPLLEFPIIAFAYAGDHR
jgi:hypothetical protein